MIELLEDFLYRNGRFHQAEIILIWGAGLDYLIGDPRNWLHPVQVMGWVISGLTQSVIKTTQKKLLRRVAGIAIAMLLIISIFTLGWLISWVLLQDHPLLAIASGEHATIENSHARSAVSATENAGCLRLFTDSVIVNRYRGGLPEYIPYI